MSAVRELEAAAMDWLAQRPANSQRANPSRREALALARAVLGFDARHCHAVQIQLASREAANCNQPNQPKEPKEPNHEAERRQEAALPEQLERDALQSIP